MTQVQSYTQNSSAYPHDSPQYDKSSEYSSDIRRCVVRRWDDYPGFGLHLSRTSSNAGVVVSEVEQSSPASACGLLSGDRIIEINGIEVENKPFVDILQILQNELKFDEVEFLVASASTPPDTNYKQAQIVRKETPHKGTHSTSKDASRTDAMMIASLVGKTTGEPWENIVDSVKQNYEKLNPRPLADDAAVATSNDLDNEFREALRSVNKNKEGDSFKADPDFERLMVASKRRSYRSTPVVIERQTGEGIGISVSPDPDIGHIISEVSPGSPADRANIKRGFVIIQIGDDVVLHLPYKKLISKLQSLNDNRIFLSVAPKDIIMRCALEHVPILTQYDTGKAASVAGRGPQISSTTQYKDVPRRPAKPAEPPRPSYQAESKYPGIGTAAGMPSATPYPPAAGPAIPVAPSFPPPPSIAVAQPGPDAPSMPFPQPGPAAPSMPFPQPGPAVPSIPSAQPSPAAPPISATQTIPAAPVMPVAPPQRQPEPSKQTYPQAYKPAEAMEEAPVRPAQFMPPPIYQPTALSEIRPGTEQPPYPTKPSPQIPETRPPRPQFSPPPVVATPPPEQKPPKIVEPEIRPSKTSPDSVVIRPTSVEPEMPPNARHLTILKEPGKPVGFQLKTLNQEGHTEKIHAFGDIIPGLAADVAGVREADRIIRINGKDVSKLSHQEVLSLMKLDVPKLEVDVVEDEVVKASLQPSAGAQPAIPKGRPRDSVSPTDSGMMTFSIDVNADVPSIGLRLTKDMVIQSVEPHGAAARVGLKRGDVVTRINSTPVSSAEHQKAFHALRQAIASGHVDLTIERSSTKTDDRDSLMSDPTKETPPHVVPPPSVPTKQIVEPRPTTFRPTSLQQPEGPRTCVITGLVTGHPIGISLKDNKDRPAEITKVTAGSAADRAGLHIRDYVLKVNGKDVEKAKFAEVKSMISASVPTGTLELEVINEELYPDYKGD